jgi:hypothetical protein
MSCTALMLFQIIVSSTLQKDVLFGIDAIPNYSLEHLEKRCLVHITLLFNLSFDSVSSLHLGIKLNCNYAKAWQGPEISPEFTSD